jgi:uncharacterized membrane-anchored protein YitT (DUF2179 family)
MRKYNHKVGLVGLLVGVIILAIGFLTHNAQLAGSLAMATILVSTIAAYYYPAANNADRSAATDHEHGSR